MQLFSAAKRFIKGRVSAVSIEPVLLVVLAVGTASVWGFIAIANNVLEGDTYAFDRWMLGAMRDPANPADPIGPRWVEGVARDVTALGGVTWLTAATVVIAIFLWLDRKTHMAIFLAAATASGGAMSLILKSLFDRPRPDLVPHLTHVSSSSFPSGHSMLSAVVFLTLGALLASSQTNLRLRIYLLGIAVFVTVLVGATRVYLGVHWPTDVLAGWTAGAAWALLCWALAEKLRRRGAVE